MTTKSGRRVGSKIALLASHIRLDVRRFLNACVEKRDSGVEGEGKWIWGLLSFEELLRVGGFNNERRGVSGKGFLGRFQEQLV
ncbi:hypothetical protein DEO72_LG8g887 [Vigna unguiculata]|uniref:Uncharacterized protein n=1 Tax=Vigna unguiculata TaxID=3917 RepID=A0A4D6MQH5_VIGUN|nr:hypothetical protein DEO72_LG8g887 [Vigna unguiculata]